MTLSKLRVMILIFTQKNNALVTPNFMLTNRNYSKYFPTLVEFSMMQLKFY